MREAYEWSDVVICRGGALTVSELIKVKRSAFIIPIPNSIDNHQILNAKFLKKKDLERFLNKTPILIT